jgi:hypothetical protein
VGEGSNEEGLRGGERVKTEGWRKKGGRKEEERRGRREEGK